MHTIKIGAYDIDATPPDLLDDIVRLHLHLDQELRQDDPPRLAADLRGFLAGGWGAPWRQRNAVAVIDGRTVGHGSWSLDPVNNPDIQWVNVIVTPDARRRGVGAALLRSMVAEAAAMGFQNQRLGFCLPTAREAIGRDLQGLVEARWGLTPAIVERRSRLDLTTKDRGKLEAELAARRSRVGERFRLVFFPMADFAAADGPLDPDSFVKAGNEIERLMPLENLEQQPEVFDRERLENLTAIQEARGRMIWNLAAVDAASGECAGYTNVSFNPRHPILVQQFGTGVIRAYQGLGLGKLLKLDMLLRLRRELPQARFIETNNAASNAGMIGINNDLGFKEYTVSHCFQVETERLLELLGTAPPD